jgi:hypothetical protein
MKDNELIKKLIVDPYFNIYTRNGLEYILSQHKHTDLDIYLVDFNNVKGMNQSMGYRKVNEIFTEVFSKLKSDFIIGRAFSGDEIFFCTDNFMFDISHIISVCKEYNLELNSIKGIYHPYYDNISIILNNLIDILHEHERNRIVDNLIRKVKFN